MNTTTPSYGRKNKMKNNETVLFRKYVDQSLLKSGFTIPNEYQSILLEKLGIMLNKGEKKTIQVIVQNNSYDATLYNYKFSEKYSDRTVIQIRYAEGSPLCVILKDIFSNSYKIISEEASKKDGKAVIAVEDEYIEVAVNDDMQLELICHVVSTKNNELARFFEYIGGERDLTGYQRSYKLVFYKCFFENEENGIISEKRLAELFKAFYVQRQESGLVSDKDVEKTIADPINASDASVLTLIIRNPFNVSNSSVSKSSYTESRSEANSTGV